MKKIFIKNKINDLFFYIKKKKVYIDPGKNHLVYAYSINEETKKEEEFLCIHNYKIFEKDDINENNFNKYNILLLSFFTFRLF